MDLTGRMFGLTYRPVKDAVLWHPDVEAYDVLEGTKLVGRIYLDMFPRDNKYKHYAQFTLANGKKAGRCPRACWCAISRSRRGRTGAHAARRR